MLRVLHGYCQETARRFCAATRILSSVTPVDEVASGVPIHGPTSGGEGSGAEVSGMRSLGSRVAGTIAVRDGDSPPGTGVPVLEAGGGDAAFGVLGSLAAGVLERRGEGVAAGVSTGNPVKLAQPSRSLPHATSASIASANAPRVHHTSCRRTSKSPLPTAPYLAACAVISISPSCEKGTGCVSPPACLRHGSAR